MIKDLISQIQVPEMHIFADEIKAKQKEIDEIYLTYQDLMENARQSYTKANAELKAMGEKQKQAIEVLKQLSEKYNELEYIVSKPLLP